MSENVKYIIGDVFTTEQPAIGHGVNIYGMMGAGIARLVRDKYPEVYEVYRVACKKKELRPGGMLPVQGNDGVWVLNLASQDKPGPYANLDWFQESLILSFEFAEAQQLVGFAIPRIGAGIGGLNWDDCLAVIDKVADTFPGITLEAWTHPKDLPAPEADVDADAIPEETPSELPLTGLNTWE